MQTFETKANKRRRAWRRRLLNFDIEPRIVDQRCMSHKKGTARSNLSSVAGLCQKMANVLSPTVARVLHLAVGSAVQRIVRGTIFRGSCDLKDVVSSGVSATGNTDLKYEAQQPYHTLLARVKNQ